MPASKNISHGGNQQGKAPVKPKPEARRQVRPNSGHAISVQPTGIPSHLVRTPQVARLAVPPSSSEDPAVGAYVTVQATHNLLTNRHKKEAGDKMLINIPMATQSEDLENSVTGGTALSTGFIANVLWNIPCPHTEAIDPQPDPDSGLPKTETVYDTRGNMVKMKNMGFTIKNSYTTAIWIHANTPICKVTDKETVVSRLVGFYQKKSRVECVYLEPGQTAKYTMPMAALQPGQAFSEFIESGKTPEMAKGRTMCLAQLLIERPTDATDNSLRQGGVAASIKPFVVYEYTDLEMEFKAVQDGKVTHVQPYSITYSNDLDDLYAITSVAITQEVTALKKRLHGQVVTLQHCDENHLRMVEEKSGALIKTDSDGVMMTVPALGVIKDGLLECQFKSKDGYIYLWDAKLDQPLESEVLLKRPTATIGEDVELTYAIDTAGVYNMNWGSFLENLGSAALQIVDEFIL